MKAFLMILALALMALVPAVYAQNLSPDTIHEETADKENEVLSIENHARIVTFYSDSCGSCKILEPKLAQAYAILNEDVYTAVKYDFSSKATIAATRHLADETGTNDTLMAYGAKTGFAVVLDSEGHEVAVLKKDMSVPAIVAKITEAVL